MTWDLYVLKPYRQPSLTHTVTETSTPENRLNTDIKQNVKPRSPRHQKQIGAAFERPHDKKKGHGGPPIPFTHVFQYFMEYPK